MKHMKTITSSLLAGAVLCSLAGCGSSSSSGAASSSASSSAAASSVSSEAASSAAPGEAGLTDEMKENIEMSYSDIISAIIENSAAGWSASAPQDLGLSSVYSYCSSTIGFVMQDITDDGISELIIGENIPGDDFTTVYDVFTADANAAISHPICGGERDIYKALEGGGFCEIGSNSATDSFTKFWKISGDKLENMQDPGDKASYVTFTFMTTLGDCLGENAGEEEGRGDIILDEDFAAMMDVVAAIQPGTTGSSIRTDDAVAAVKTFLNGLEANDDMVWVTAQTTEYLAEYPGEDNALVDNFAETVDELDAALQSADPDLYAGEQCTKLLEGMRAALKA